jgi:hypothetical protein
MRNRRAQPILAALAVLWLATAVIAVAPAHGAVFLPPAFRPPPDPAIADRIAGAEHVQALAVAGEEYERRVAAHFAAASSTR